MPLVYDELIKLAAAKLANEKPGQTLQATALVHDAYIRLVDVEKAQHWNSRGNFLGAAAEAMRRIMVENARRKGRLKHGGAMERVDLEAVLLQQRLWKRPAPRSNRIMTTFSPLEAIFFAALEKGSPAERAAYLDEACADDRDLRERVERMLAAQVQAGSFLEVPAQEMNQTLDQPITEKSGTQIGPYKLLQQLGEGGMGVVYMAEQKEPVKRRVALKIVKPGMDTRQVIARFEAERRVLAMMDHPNIAKVLDAGQTDSGKPYFVMELVKGMPVTKYCDEQHLTPKERLELFVPICQAVQHAHQKGIIHRDLKPSNILVALYDGQPVPKIIDFGVAKATSQTLTEKTMFTQVGQVVGTLEYMAPEQAQVNQLDGKRPTARFSIVMVTARHVATEGTRNLGRVATMGSWGGVSAQCCRFV